MPTILSLDVGDKRVGVAIASVVARLARPLLTLPRDDNLVAALQKIIKEEDVQRIVIGLPRGLEGQHTAQTQATESFIAELQSRLEIAVDTQDEALTSVQAETELAQARSDYQRGDVDALAASYILEDWLQEHQAPEGNHAPL